MPDSAHIPNPTPITPPTPAVRNDSNSSNKFNLLLIGSILVFVLIVGATLYLILINRQEHTAGENSEEMQISNDSTQTTPITPVVSMTPEETLEKYGVVCRRFTSVDEALREAQIACDLDLSGQNLSTLPSGITELKNLNSINLSDNNLIEFPTVLYGMPTLLKMDLSNNKLSEIPEDILTHIPTLQSVLLEGNNLPASIVSQYTAIAPAPQQ